LKNYKNILIPIVIAAGDEIMKYYGKNYTITSKKDKSPVTDADIAANNIIINGLQATQLPIISEETKILSYEERKNWKTYWLIDPLDGTKQFVNHQDEFTVNIALIKDNRVVEGIVYIPVTNVLYYGNIENGSIKIDMKSDNVKEEKLPLLITNAKLRIIASKSHLNAQTKTYLKHIKIKVRDADICHFGSSLKFCSVAEGTADIYPRLGSISEWDIGAGHAILKSAGGNVIDMHTGKEIEYNSQNLKTPDFIAYIDKNKLNKLLTQ
jgi:3'(2'), 5'-bisphosphate nucleotidase